MRRSILLMVLSAALLASCSKHEEEKPAGVLPAYQQKALNDARAVQTTIDDAETRRREELEKIYSQ